MEISHVLPKYTNCLAGKHNHIGDISPRSVIVYAHKVIRQINEEDPNTEGKKTPSRKCMMKASGLRHKRAKQINPRLDWKMFKEVCLMYQDIK